MSTSIQNGEALTGETSESPVREIHSLPPPPARRRYSAPISSGSRPPGADIAAISRELNELAVAEDNGDDNGLYEAVNNDNDGGSHSNGNNEREHDQNSESRTRQEVVFEANPSAIVPRTGSDSSQDQGRIRSAERVRKEAVEAKIVAWESAKLAKINNRFKREDAVINGWESEQVAKATSKMRMVERKLEERRARAEEKMENEVARARRKAEEKRASAESKRGTAVAKVVEAAELMRAAGKAPSKLCFLRFS